MNAELLAAVKALPRDQKVELLGEVWASLDDSFDPPISSAQATELRRRLKAFAADREATIAWDDVKANGRKIVKEIRRAKKSKSAATMKKVSGVLVHCGGGKLPNRDFVAEARDHRIAELIHRGTCRL